MGLRVRMNWHVPRTTYLLSISMTLALLVYCEATESDTVQVQLGNGWNLISLPVDPGSNSIQSVLLSIQGYYDAVFAYNSYAGVWEIYLAEAPDFLNTLHSMEPGRGYWVHTIDSALLEITGDEIADTSVQFNRGPNLIGYNSLKKRPVRNALSSIHGRYLSVWTYSNPPGAWMRYNVGGPYPNSLEQLEPGKGYLIHAKEDCIWDVRAEEPGRVRIAFWNIRIFSNGSRDDEELQQICDVLKDYDMIAIAELRDEEVLQRAVAMLEDMGKTYAYEISSEVGRGVKERYAFLYEIEDFEVAVIGEVFPDPNDDFIREPYYATFKAGEFDFTIINIHVIWGSTLEGRRAEIRKLDDVYSAIQAEDENEQDVMLVGDFNRPPDDGSFDELRCIEYMTCLFMPPAASNIVDTNLYDNIWFQFIYLNEYSGNCGIDKFDETDFGNDDEAANLAVSDHRPVWAEFFIDIDDD